MITRDVITTLMNCQKEAGKQLVEPLYQKKTQFAPNAETFHDHKEQKKRHVDYLNQLLCTITVYFSDSKRPALPSINVKEMSPPPRPPPLLLKNSE